VTMVMRTEGRRKKRHWWRCTEAGCSFTTESEDRASDHTLVCGAGPSLRAAISEVRAEAPADPALLGVDEYELGAMLEGYREAVERELGERLVAALTRACAEDERVIETAPSLEAVADATARLGTRLAAIETVRDLSGNTI